LTLLIAEAETKCQRGVTDASLKTNLAYALIEQVLKVI